MKSYEICQDAWSASARSSGDKPCHINFPSFLRIQQESAVRLLQKLVKVTVADLLPFFVFHLGLSENRVYSQ